MRAQQPCSVHKSNQEGAAYVVPEAESDQKFQCGEQVEVRKEGSHFGENCTVEGYCQDGRTDGRERVQVVMEDGTVKSYLESELVLTGATRMPLQTLPSTMFAPLRRISLQVLPKKRLALTSKKEALQVQNRLQRLNKVHSGLIVKSVRWDGLMMILLFFTATVTPFEVCFMNATGFDFLFWLNRVVDIGFIIDLVLQFRMVRIFLHVAYLTFAVVGV